ncbi:MAG: hypothetical protein ACFFD2_17675 [Promethearchaeota archaeon]
MSILIYLLEFIKNLEFNNYLTLDVIWVFHTFISGPTLAILFSTSLPLYP